MSDNNPRPFTIKIFVPEGDPDGLRIVGRSNWTGTGVVFNRTNYKQAAARPEFSQTGVYILVGTSEESALPTIYVGEGDPVSERLKSHYANKDFWDWAVFFVTGDGSLNKAHVKYLESRLLELAGAAKQCHLDNAKGSSRPNLSEADQADVESFLLDMLSIFPLLGLGIFEKTETKKQPRDLLYIEAKGVQGRGYEDAKGFVVLKGSHSAQNETNSLHPHMSNLRKDLIDQGVLVLDGDHYVFTQDRTFQSPSAAAGVVIGGSTNGRFMWRRKDGTTLKQIQQAAAAEVTPDE